MTKPREKFEPGSQSARHDNPDQWERYNPAPVKKAGAPSRNPSEDRSRPGENPDRLTATDDPGHSTRPDRTMG
jgi:hypothetical protein